MLRKRVEIFAALLIANPAFANLSAQHAVATKRLSKKGHIELVLIPTGDFIMGGTGPYDTPKSKIYLDSFLIGKTPVTVAQFKAYCRDQKIDFGKFREPRWGWIDNHPMVNVTWKQARDFCRWAGGDLPTESQWEKAARGTDGRQYPWGNKFDPKLVRCSRKQIGDAGSTVAVGSYPKNASPYGCLDMSGNVFQWCLSWYTDPFPNSIVKDFTDHSSNQFRVLRGGSWYECDPTLLRSALCYGNFDATYSSDGDGFRLYCPK